MKEKKEKKEKKESGLSTLIGAGGLVAGGQLGAELAAEAAIEGRRFNPKKTFATMAVSGLAGLGIGKAMESVAESKKAKKEKLKHK
jgi:hypothetical protein